MREIKGKRAKEPEGKGLESPRNATDNSKTDEVVEADLENVVAAGRTAESKTDAPRTAPQYLFFVIPIKPRRAISGRTYIAITPVI